MLYSELKSKAVLSLDGAYLGAVTGAFFSKETNDCTAIAAERGIFSPDDVYAVKDVVTLKQGAQDLAIPSEETHMFLTSDMEVYDCKGETVGRITDFYVEAHNKKENVFMTESENFSLRKLLFSSGRYAVVNKGDQLPRKKRAKNAQNFVGTAPARVVLQATPMDELFAPASAHPIDYQNYGEYRFLVGRTLSKTLTDLSRNVVFATGTVITNDVIEEAKKRGKLSELMKYSK